MTWSSHHRDEFRVRGKALLRRTPSPNKRPATDDIGIVDAKLLCSVAFPVPEKLLSTRAFRELFFAPSCKTE
jgi:hypothetical protein